MGGQDGYSRDLLDYNEESNNIMAGIKIRPSDRWDLGLNLAYTTAEGGLSQFDLPADDYVAITPPMSYDFSKSHTYSNIDVERFNFDAIEEASVLTGGLDAEFGFGTGGVLNVVTGFGLEAGKPLATSPRVQKVAFTGETGTGTISNPEEVKDA